MRMIEVALIEESLTNPRKHFDQVKLKELANSIAASGVHQPILVRPLPGSRVPDTFGFRRKGQPLPAYELVAGARRLRACLMANVLEIPAVIRELTDDQAMEVAIIENLQRDDLSELEEAEGYEHLMKHNGMTAEEVGTKIGKSRSYVYARLKLVDGCIEVRTALRTGQIDASKALLLARIPDHALQIKALQEISQTNHEGEPDFSYREAARHIQQHYMLRLDAARFTITDASLVPNVGPCNTCTKRTGHEPDLFADVKSADVCTDPACYHTKEEAHDAGTIAKAQKLGGKVISGNEARELMPYAHGEITGYSKLDSDAYRLGIYGDTLRKSLGKLCPKPTIIINPFDGEPVAVIPTATARKLIAENSRARKTQASAQQAAQQAATPVEERPAYRKQWQDLATARIDTALRTGGTIPIPAELLRVQLLWAMEMDAEPFAPALGIPDDEFDDDYAAKRLLLTPDEDMPMVYIRWALFEAMSRSHYSSKDILTDSEPRHTLPILAELAGIDVLAIREEVKRAMESEDRAKAMEAEAATAKKSQKTATAPQLAAQPREGAGGEDTAANAKGGDKKTARPAAQRPVRKTTAEEAQQGIAAAMQGLGEEGTPGAAVAAQGNEAPPVASAQVATATTDAAAADVSTAAPVKAVLASGVKVTVLPNASGPKQKAMIGKVGTINQKMGPTAWDVRFTGKLARFVAFDASELEVAE